MSNQDFESNYQNLSDVQLLSVLADKTNLLPEAAIALDKEICRRQLSAAPHPRWFRGEEEVHCLEDYLEYKQSVDQARKLSRLWYLRAMAPFILVLILSRVSSRDYPLLIFPSLIWAFAYAAYLFSLKMRLLGYRCPQCSESFGRGEACFNCGFPRKI